MKAINPDLLRFDDHGLIVAIAQEVTSGAVLMVAYMDREALQRTVDSGEAHFWSRSRKSPWHKGETSGNFLHVEAIQADCDADALLLSVHPTGPACHTGSRSCFAAEATLLEQLDATLAERRRERPPGSYTTTLFDAGRAAILRKLGEEAVETILAGTEDDDGALLHEVADLWFHSLVLLAERGLSGSDVLRVLAERRRARQVSQPG